MPTFNKIHINQPIEANTRQHILDVAVSMLNSSRDNAWKTQFQTQDNFIKLLNACKTNQDIHELLNPSWTGMLCMVEGCEHHMDLEYVVCIPTNSGDHFKICNHCYAEMHNSFQA